MEVGALRQKPAQKELVHDASGRQEGAGPALRALGTPALSSCRFLLLRRVNVTEKASGVLVDRKALQS